MIVKFSEKKNVCFDAKRLYCDLGVRYFENAELTIDGCTFDDDGNSPKIPATKVIDNDIRWCPEIDIESGRIMNWCNGIAAKVSYKVCDDGRYTVTDGQGNAYVVESYVPGCLSIGESGYGDYVHLDIDSDGYIDDWNFNDDDMLELLKGDFERGEDFDEYDGC